MNWQLLKGTVYSKGMTMQQMAQKTGIVYSTLMRQCKSGTLTIGNVKKIRECLDLTSQETNAIFFGEELA